MNLDRGEETVITGNSAGNNSMTTHRLKVTLEPIARDLETIVTRREGLIKESRLAISLASKSIVNIHIGKIDEAETSLKEAQILLKRLRKTADSDLRRYLVSPETEYVEAETIMAVASGKQLPIPEKLGVSHEAYLLGLLDAVGELKRMVFDSIRRGDIDRASRYFVLMEDIYIHLSPFAIYDHVVQGFRRKLDVTRSLVEATRAAVTEETRRAEFIKDIDRATKRVSQKK
jgi:translin